MPTFECIPVSARKSQEASSSTSASASASTSTSSTSSIRSRYLHRLGVTARRTKVAPMMATPTTNNNKCTLEPLKRDLSRPDDTLTIHSPPQHTMSSSSAIRFQSSVQVHSIPNRQELGIQLLHDLWMPPRELEQAVHRNSIEFASEGWDWRKATEEQDFVYFGGGNQNELVHPAHVARSCNVQRQLLMILQAQQQHKQRQLLR